MLNISKEKVIGFLDAITEWCVYVLIVAVTFSNSIVEIVSTVMIVAWILGLVLKNDLKKLMFPVAFMLLAYFVWVLLSCFNSAHSSESFRGIFKALQYSLVFMAAAMMVWTPAKLKKFLFFVIGAILLVGVDGIFQYVTGIDFIRHRTLMPEDYLRRISASFIHPNDFGAYLMVMASLLVSMLVSSKNGMKRTVLFLAAFILVAGCLFLTRSRGSWMSFGLAFITVGMLKGKKIAVLFVVILATVFILMPSSSRQRIYDTANFKSGTTWERVQIWQGNVNMIKVHPVLGFGVNTYSKHFPEYKPAEYPDDRYAHNCYLQMASEIGIPGALLFLAFIFMALFASFKRIVSLPDGTRKSLAVGLFGGTLGFVLNSAVDTHLYSLTLAVFFYILLGSLFSLSGNFREEI